ncbi:hypothetical protein QR680_016431 [Steinernema hermaphroditum]|uniref:glucuronosyltransferase n=1 Tax=Steinernema hermaphroditum TaxID=289476 RepID=A0AA39HBJ4_9BILA|nr:hypothetical protein QR680_016431 [Steinernema hermaphroditum]
MASVEFCIVLLFVLFHYAICGNVLVTFAHDFDSHVNSMKPFFKRLADVGHNVTVLDTSTKPKPRNFGANINVVHLYFAAPETTKTATNVYWRYDGTSARLPMLFARGDRVLGDILQQHQKKFNEILNMEWDLIVMDELYGIHQNAIAYILKRKTNTPSIVFATSMFIISTYINNALGRISSTRMGMFVPVPKDSSDVWNAARFDQRLYATVYDSLEYIGLRYYLPLTGGLRNLHRLTPSDFTFTEFSKEASLHLTEQIDRLPFPLPESNDLRLIGSHCGTVKPLPSTYLDFISDPSSKGTIYVAFGSTIDLTYAPDFIWNAFEEALDELQEYRIVFAYGGIKRLNVGSHVMVTKWAPQLDILDHEKTHLFISHGGLKSFKEAICTKTPVVFLPLFGDQAMNTRMSLEMGFGRTVNKHTVSKEILLGEINEILTNYGKYQRNIVKLHNIYSDRLIPVLDEGVFYAERLMRGHGDRQPFRRRGIDLSWTTYLYTDWLLLLGMEIPTLTAVSCANITPFLSEFIYPEETRRIIFGATYVSLASIGIPICLFVLSVFSRKALREHSCYKLLTITGILDTASLLSAGIICGLLSLLNLQPCNGHRWTSIFTYFTCMHWYTYCAASEVLALNRMLIFVKEDWAKLLFHGKKTWFWLTYILLYPVLCTFLHPSEMFYVYDPYGGVAHDGKHYPFHAISNFMKLSSVTAMYIVMTIGLLWKLRKSGNATVLASQISISLQTLLVAALADFSAVVYIFAQNIIDGAYLGFVAQVSWICTHLSTGIIYLTANNQVREEFVRKVRKIFSKKPFISNIISMDTSGNVATNSAQTHMVSSA